MLIIRGVNVYPSEIEAHLVGLPGIAPYYQLVLSREGVMDTLTVEVEATAETAAESYAAIAAEVAGLFRTRIGLGCTVEVKAPGEVPRSEGKAVRVRDLRAL
jgi:phenylacetate-CoA ligase